MRLPNRDPPTQKHSRDTGTPTPERYLKVRPSLDTPLSESAPFKLIKERYARARREGIREKSGNTCSSRGATWGYELPRTLTSRFELDPEPNT